MRSLRARTRPDVDSMHARHELRHTRRLVYASRIDVVCRPPAYRGPGRGPAAARNGDSSTSSVAHSIRTGQYGSMDFLLLILGIVNGVLFAVLGVQSWRLGRRIASPRARTQAHILVLVCTAFVLASTLRIGLQLVEVGALSESTREVVLTWVQFITGAGALLVIVPALWMLRRLTAVFAKTDQFVTVLTDKVTLDSSVSDAGLTARELEVLEHVAEGTLSDAELAQALYISPSTAATHVRNIMKKTGVRRRHELMLLAVDNRAAAGG